MGERMLTRRMRMEMNVVQEEMDSEGWSLVSRPSDLEVV